MIIHAGQKPWTPYHIDSIVSLTGVGGSVLFVNMRRLLKKLDEANLGDGITREHIAAASSERFDKIKVTETYELYDGKEFVLEFAEPALLIAELVASSEGLTKAYTEAIRNYGSVSWRAIVAFDEFAPGNKLRVDNRRKAMNCYVSFLELGQHCLAESAAWAIPLVVRHQMLVRIPGGWARVLRRFLDRLLFGVHGLATAGMALQLGGTAVVVHARLHCILADGEGLKQSFDWKGSSGLKPCLRCFNLTKKGSDLAGRREGFVEVTCPDPSKFRAWTQDRASQTMSMLNEAAKRVDLGTIPKARLEELTMVYGLNPNEHSLWSHPRLSAACTTDLLGTVTYDWVHSLLQDGSWSIEAWAFLQACEPHGFTTSDLCAWLKDKAWQWPKASHCKSRQLWHIFDTYRSQSSETANKLKAQASELLSLFAMLRHFVDTTVERVEELAAPRASFEAACRILHIILLCKRGKPPKYFATPAPEWVLDPLGHGVSCGELFWSHGMSQGTAPAGLEPTRERMSCKSNYMFRRSWPTRGRRKSAVGAPGAHDPSSACLRRQPHSPEASLDVPYSSSVSARWSHRRLFCSRERPPPRQAHR